MSLDLAFTFLCLCAVLCCVIALWNVGGKAEGAGQGMQAVPGCCSTLCCEKPGTTATWTAA